MNWVKKHLYFLPVFFYLPALGNFFSGDDWFHLRISQISSVQQFFNFFSFSPNAQTASFYRPLSTQVFFFVFQKFFGLVAWPYYLFGLIIFGYSLYLVKKFSSQYLRSEICDLTSFIYGISVSNFTRTYFLSAYQELFLVVFSLLTLINFKKKPLLSLLFFVLALLSKETAIILPLLIILLNFDYIKNNFHHLRSTIYATTILAIVYLYYRFFHFGLATGDSYLWNFSLVKATNTLMWYILWAFGAPELLVDYVGSGLRLIPRFFTDYQFWWPVIIFPLLGVIVSTCLIAIKKLPDFKYILFFIIALLPVLFLPSHKFTLELGLPLIGFSIVLASILPNKFNVLSFWFFAFLIFTNLSMNYLTYTRHYSVSRGKIAKKVYAYFSKEYPQYPIGKEFFFINDANDNGQIWGQSKQIAQAVSNSELFKVIYKNKNLKINYQDLDKHKSDQDTIEISTILFLKQ